MRDSVKKTKDVILPMLYEAVGLGNRLNMGTEGGGGGEVKAKAKAVVLLERPECDCGDRYTERAGRRGWDGKTRM